MSVDPIELITTTLKKFLAADYPGASLTPLLGGRSGTQVFLVNTKKKTYVLRVCDPAFSREKVRRTFALMQFAADIGIAPELYDTHAESGCVIMEFVTGKKLRDYVSQVGQAGQMNTGVLKKLAQTIRQLHQGPRVDPAPSTFDNIRERMNQIREYDAAIPSQVGDEWGEISGLATIERAIKIHSVPLKPCHGDLNPANILLQDLGPKIYFLDWDRSGLGDPFRDLATVAVFLRLSDGQNKNLLSDYSSGGFDAQDYAHFNLLRHGQLFLGALWAFQYPYSSGLAAGSRLYTQLEMNDRMNDPTFPTFEMLDPTANPQAAIDFQNLGLSCLKQYTDYLSSFDFKVHLDVLSQTQRKSIFLEKSLVQGE